MAARWTASGSTAAYNDATLQSDEYQNPSFVAVPGERLPDAPAVNFNIIGRYEWNLRAALRLFTQFDLFLEGSMWNDLRLDQRLSQPAYSISNLRLGVSRPDGTWRAEKAYVTNLWNSNAVLFVNTTGYDTYRGIESGGSRSTADLRLAADVSLGRTALIVLPRVCGTR